MTLLQNEFKVSQPTLYLQKKHTQGFDLIPSEDENDLCRKLKDFAFEKGDQLLVSDEDGTLLKLTLDEPI